MKKKQKTLTIFWARASWMDEDDIDACFWHSSVLSIPSNQCRRLSKPSWTLWDWATDFCSKSVWLDILLDRFWNLLSMESIRKGKKNINKEYSMTASTFSNTNSGQTYACVMPSPAVAWIFLQSGSGSSWISSRPRRAFWTLSTCTWCSARSHCKVCVEW